MAQLLRTDGCCYCVADCSDGKNAPISSRAVSGMVFLFHFIVTLFSRTEFLQSVIISVILCCIAFPFRYIYISLLSHPTQSKITFYFCCHSALQYGPDLLKKNAFFANRAHIVQVLGLCGPGLELLLLQQSFK